MQNDDSERHPIVKATDDLIAAVEKQGLSDAVNLLKMARLELAVQLNGITAQELRAFAKAIGRPSGNVISLNGQARRKLADALYRKETQAK